MPLSFSTIPSQPFAFDGDAVTMLAVWLLAGAALLVMGFVAVLVANRRFSRRLVAESAGQSGVADTATAALAA